MNPDNITLRLNKISPKLQFEMVNSESWEAEYFGDELSFTLTLKRGRPCSPAIFSLTHHSGARAVMALPPGMGRLSRLRAFLKWYLDGRPFTIVRQAHGSWRLLDPNGMDHIGEFVTLKDACRTCGYHYSLYR